MNNKNRSRAEFYQLQAPRKIEFVEPKCKRGWFNFEQRVHIRKSLRSTLPKYSSWWRKRAPSLILLKDSWKSILWGRIEWTLYKRKQESRWETYLVWLSFQQYQPRAKNPTQIFTSDLTCLARASVTNSKIKQTESLNPCVRYTHCKLCTGEPPLGKPTIRRLRWSSNIEETSQAN